MFSVAELPAVQLHLFIKLAVCALSTGAPAINSVVIYQEQKKSLLIKPSLPNERVRLHKMSDVLHAEGYEKRKRHGRSRPDLFNTPLGARKKRRKSSATWAVSAPESQAC
jgi:hypothetical protein